MACLLMPVPNASIRTLWVIPLPGDRCSMGFVRVGAAIFRAISWIEANSAVTRPGGWAGAGGALRQQPLRRRGVSGGCRCGERVQ